MNFFNNHNIGALGQTRTGTPKWARILSPLCLPISPRGHSLIIICLSYLLQVVAEKTQSKKYFSLSMCQNCATHTEKEQEIYTILEQLIQEKLNQKD